MKVGSLPLQTDEATSAFQTSRRSSPVPGSSFHDLYEAREAGEKDQRSRDSAGSEADADRLRAREQVARELCDQVWVFPSGSAGTGAVAPADAEDRAIDGAAETEETGGVSTPARLLELSTEIVASLRLAGDGNIEMLFDSAVLGGLQVNLSRTSEGLRVSFTAASDEIRNLLAAHVPALAESLSASGFDVREIRVGTLKSGSSDAPNPHSGGRSR